MCGVNNRAMIWIIRALLLVCLCSIVRGAKDPVVLSLTPERATGSLAHQVLALEGESDPESAVRLKLERLIEGALRRLESAQDEGEAEIARARRFFETVDRALIESDVIFPPDGNIDFLRDGLKPRLLTEGEFTRAEARFANSRRLPWMRANQRAGGSFYFFDCDLASIFYVAVAERLGFPVSVEQEKGGQTLMFVIASGTGRWSVGWMTRWHEN